MCVTNRDPILLQQDIPEYFLLRCKRKKLLPSHFQFHQQFEACQTKDRQKQEKQKQVIVTDFVNKRQKKTCLNMYVFISTLFLRFYSYTPKETFTS